MCKFQEFQQHRINVNEGTFIRDPSDKSRWSTSANLINSIYPFRSRSDYIHAKKYEHHWDYKSGKFVFDYWQRTKRKYLKWLVKRERVDKMSNMDNEGIVRIYHPSIRCLVPIFKAIRDDKDQTISLMSAGYDLFEMRMNGMLTTASDMFHRFMEWNLNQYFKAKYKHFMSPNSFEYTGCFNIYDEVIDNIKDQIQEIEKEERSIKRRQWARLRSIKMAFEHRRGSKKNSTRKEIGFTMIAANGN